MWVQMKIRELIKARAEIVRKLQEGRTVCLSCGYDGEDIQGEYPDLDEGCCCPKCQSCFVVKKATGTEIDYLGGECDG